MAKKKKQAGNKSPKLTGNIYIVSHKFSKLRDKAEITQEELQQRTGISQGDLSKLENNKVDNLTIDTVGFLADGFDVDIEELFKK